MVKRVKGNAEAKAPAGMERYSLFLRRDQLDRLRAIQDEQGVPVAVQIRRALDATLHPGTLSLAEAAKLLAVSPDTIMRLRREASLPAIPVGTTWRFEPDALHACVKRTDQSYRERMKKGGK